MLSLIVRFCSITIVCNVRIVKTIPNSTVTDSTNTNTKNLTIITEVTATTTTTEEPSTTPSLNDYDWDLFCHLQPNGYDCANDEIGSTRYYYDVKIEECVTFVFGGCGGNQRNIFETAKECRLTCKVEGKKTLDPSYSPNVFCRLQPDFGNCDDYNAMYYFDVTQRKCVGFSYSGCGGNQNRFKNRHHCHQICADKVDAYEGKTEDLY